MRNPGIRNLKPIRPGEVRNPTGRNQYSARRDFEARIQAMLAAPARRKSGKTYGDLVAETVIGLALEGDRIALVECLKRLWPVPSRHELVIDVEAEGTERRRQEAQERIRRRIEEIRERQACYG